MFAREYAPPGSDLYYVLQQVPEAARIPYLAIHALAQQLQESAERYQDRNTAEQKLAWWAEEIERLYRHESLHPLTQSLNAYLGEYTLRKVELLALVETALLTLRTEIFTTQAELLQHYQHSGGILAALKAKILLRRELPEALLKAVHQLGISLEIMRHLLYFPAFLARQQLYLPLSLFQQHSLDPQQILQGRGLEQLQPLFAAQAEHAEEMLQGALESLMREERRNLRPLLLEAKLRQKQLEKIAADAWQIFRYRLELSPLVKLLLTRFSS